MSVTANGRDRLKTIRDRTHNARNARSHARRQMDAAREAGDQEAGAIALLAYDQADEQLQIAERLESQLLGQMAGVSGSGYGRGESIFTDPQTIETLERLGNGRFPIGAVDLGPLGTVEDTVAMIESGSWKGGMRALGTDVDVPESARLGTYYGTVPPLRRRLSVLDLIPTSPMSGKSFGYMQESGPYGAAEVVEGEIKPEDGLILTEAEVTAATIAVWKKMKRQELADTPSLSTTINDRLQYSVFRRLEDQVIAGDGQGENLLGILNQPNLPTVPYDAAAAASDLVLDAVTEVFENDAAPDAVVLEPSDLNAMLKAKTSGSGQRLDSGGAFASTPATLWGYPAIPSNAMPSGQVLVGAFSTQARLFIREPIQVRLSDSDSDDFIRNRLTALAELRAGLAVWAPQAFCVVSLTAGTGMQAQRGGPAKK